jgi:hypothetical protein
VPSNAAGLNAALNIAAGPKGLNASLQGLSSGLKVNSGAGPAAFVTSQLQAAQVAGLNSAIQSTNATVSLVQTGQGALNQIQRPAAGGAIRDSAASRFDLRSHQSPSSEWRNHRSRPRTRSDAGEIARSFQ